MFVYICSEFDENSLQNKNFRQQTKNLLNRSHISPTQTSNMCEIIHRSILFWLNNYKSMFLTYLQFHINNEPVHLYLQYHVAWS